MGIDGNCFERWTSDNPTSASDLPDVLIRDGEVKPLSTTTALRRLAFRTIRRVANDKTATSVGQDQSAVDVFSAVGKVAHASPAESGSQKKHPLCALVFIQERILDQEQYCHGRGGGETFPMLCKLFNTVVCDTTAVLWQYDRAVHELTAPTRVDQGCPLTLLMFCFGMQRVMSRCSASLTWIKRRSSAGLAMLTSHATSQHLPAATSASY